METITMYSQCDVFRGTNNVEPLGFAKTNTLGNMIDLAITHKCPIIIKDGKGKWYLKGQGKEEVEIRAAIETNKGKFPRQKCWYIVFSYEDGGGDDGENENESDDKDKEKQL